MHVSCVCMQIGAVLAEFGSLEPMQGRTYSPCVFRGLTQIRLSHARSL